jgi:MFS family permease
VVKSRFPGECIVFTRLRLKSQEFPRQFWLMFIGMLISTIGSSMIWPFLMIYVSERLALPLAAIASLLTINAAAGLISSFIAGPITDRLGRKWVMVISLAVNGGGYVLLSQATTLPAFAIIMTLQGAFNPLYRVGADAMMADLIPPEKRMDAYSLLRMSNNIGVSVGPAVGGFIASVSYTFAFIIAAVGMGSYALLLTIFARETLPRLESRLSSRPERFGGYGQILRDRPFMSFVATFALTQVTAAMLWVLLSVYTKENYQLSERMYGLIPTTNALMVVFFQMAVTRMTKSRAPMRVLALGSLFYALGVGSVALGRGFWAFWLSMVITTIGELILTPTATTLAANLAPVEMRGRYMSIYGLTWAFGQGIGPLFGGLLNDNLGPFAIWYGAGMIGMLAVAAFLLLARRYREGDVAGQAAPSGVD